MRTTGPCAWCGLDVALHTDPQVHSCAEAYSHQLHLALTAAQRRAALAESRPGTRQPRGVAAWARAHLGADLALPTVLYVAGRVFLGG